MFYYGREAQHIQTILIERVYNNASVKDWLADRWRGPIQAYFTM